MEDSEFGGIADRPDNVADVFHTVFGIAGLSLLQGEGQPELISSSKDDEREPIELEQVDPTYCLPAKLTAKLGIARPFQSFR